MLLKKKIQQIKTLYFFFIFFLLKIKFNITLNIHIYELIKQTLVDTHRKLTKCREFDSTTNHQEAYGGGTNFVNILNIKNVNNKLSLGSVWISRIFEVIIWTNDNPIFYRQLS
jgi:hypothetical protein